MARSSIVRRTLKGVSVVEKQRGADPGPSLVVIGGLHGNEPAGVGGLQRVMDTLADCPVRPLRRGELTALLGNQTALEQGRRFLQRDLNRGWHEDGLAPRNEAAAEEYAKELAEARRIDRVLRTTAERSRGALFLLDIHTTSGFSHPFLNVADTLPSRAFAAALGAPMVLGLDETLEGTLLQHAEDYGYVGLVLEAGQHEDPRSVDFAEAAIWIALDYLGLLDSEALRKPLAWAHRAYRDLPMRERMFEVTYRHAVNEGATFSMRPGFESFQPLEAGTVLADHAGEFVQSPNGSFMLMPLYQQQGDDGFFLMREYGPGRRWLSHTLRRLRAERLLTLLPNIERVEGNGHALRIDPGWWRRRPVRDLLHLLGFRQVVSNTEQDPVVARRRTL